MKPHTTGSVKQRQDPLRKRYLDAPDDARITDRARAASGGADAFHGTVRAGEGQSPPWNFGIHRAVGGDHDLPNPGDVLCAALAACLDSTLRMVAERMGLALESLEVEVQAFADVRGCLMVDPDVAVGFQRLEVAVAIVPAEGTKPALVKALITTAEQCCVVLQTLRDGVTVRTRLGGPVGSEEPVVAGNTVP